jgi:hypothetical protein
MTWSRGILHSVFRSKFCSHFGIPDMYCCHGSSGVSFSSVDCVCCGSRYSRKYFPFRSWASAGMRVDPVCKS